MPRTIRFAVARLLALCSAARSLLLVHSRVG
jgi:hypothetical protein